MNNHNTETVVEKSLDEKLAIAAATLEVLKKNDPERSHAVSTGYGESVSCGAKSGIYKDPNIDILLRRAEKVIGMVAGLAMTGMVIGFGYSKIKAMQAIKGK